MAGLAWINLYKGEKINLRAGTTPSPPATVSHISWSCHTGELKNSMGTIGYNATMRILNLHDVPIVDPATAPPSASPCTLVALPPISFMSGTTNVAGMRRNEQLHVICTAGVAIDYTVRLLANSETNGRLQFDSGASAQITLNGKNLVANGEKHVFPTLVTSDIDLGIELVGSASEAGVSTATGILLLEAL
ncbi:hypothetical protein [Serratia fonticola]